MGLGLHCTAFHCTSLYCISGYCTALDYSAVHYTEVDHAALNHATMLGTALHLGNFLMSDFLHFSREEMVTKVTLFFLLEVVNIKILAYK